MALLVKLTNFHTFSNMVILLIHFQILYRRYVKMKENEKKNKSQGIIEQQITDHETIKDSFRQNAPFAEKNLQNECMFTTQNDNHDDVKQVTRERIENILKAIDVIEQKIAPSNVNHIGRNGIYEWLWENKITNEIPLDILKTYLHKKKKMDAFHFYSHYKLILELVQEISVYYHTPVPELMDEQVVNEELMHHLVESFAITQRKKRLMTELCKQINIDFVVDTSPESSSKLRKKKAIHPKVLEYQKQLQKEGMAKHTQNNFLNYMNMFLPWIAKNILDFTSYDAHTIPIIKINEMHLNEFRAYLLKKVRKGEYSPISISECIFAVKHFFQYLKKTYGFPNPAKKIKSVKAPRYKFRELPSDEQINEFFNVIEIYSDKPEVERIAFRLMLALGLRSSEVSQISWEDINFGIRTIKIHSKGEKSHVLPLVENLYDDLQRMRQVSSLSSKYLFGKNVEKIRRDLYNNYKLYSFIAGWTFPGGVHLFRHIFITKLATKKVLPQILKELSRVERVDTVTLYLHLNQKQNRLTHEINKLNYNH